MSAIAFAPSTSTKLLVSSWDKKLYYYDVSSGAGETNLLNTYEHRAPVLDVCFGSDDNEAFTAGMDWVVSRCGQTLEQASCVPTKSLTCTRRIDLESGDKTALSKHEAPVRCVTYSVGHGKPQPKLVTRAGLTLNRHPSVCILGL